MLSRQVHGKPLVYLDNGATTQRPNSVIDAEASFYREHNANIHRGAHGLGSEATAIYEQARADTADFIGAASSHEIIFTRSTTEAINLVAQAWGRANIKAGDEIVLSAAEHHANLVPWWMLAQEKGAILKVLPLDQDGRIDLVLAKGLIGPRCKVLAFAWVSNVLAAVNDAKALCALGKAQGAVTLVDAAQAAPHFALNVKDLGADFVAFSAHKMLGPTGVGVLWGREALLESMPPWQGGGSMISSVTFEKIEFNRPPWKFEAGTPNIAGVAAFGEALRYLKAIGWQTLAAQEDNLTRYALGRLSSVLGLKLYGPSKAEGRIAVFSFNLEGVDPGDAGALLDSFGIEVRVGHHCVQPLMAALGCKGMVRASLYLYNTEQEVDFLAESLLRVQKIAGRPTAKA